MDLLRIFQFPCGIFFSVVNNIVFYPDEESMHLRFFCESDDNTLKRKKLNFKSVNLSRVYFDSDPSKINLISVECLQLSIFSWCDCGIVQYR